MSILRRLLGTERAPDWASFMAGEEYRAFVAALDRELRRRGRPFRLDADGVYIDRPGGEPEVYGLSNLAQLCHQIDRSDWPVAIATHFRNLDEAGAAPDSLEDFAVARPLLKARVYSRNDIPPDALSGLVTTPLTPDLFGALVLDLPTTVRTVASQTVREWPEPVDQLFATAREHLAAEMASYERADLTLESGGAVGALSAPSFFVASQILRLGELVGEAQNGALVALPNRHGLFWHVIEDAGKTIAAIKALLPIAHRLHQDGPGSLTPELHWWHRGALTALPSRIEGSRIDFAPPEAFNELLAGLVEDGAQRT
jgi:hypothetical protein